MFSRCYLNIQNKHLLLKLTEKRKKYLPDMSFLHKHAKILPQVFKWKFFICIFLSVGMPLKYKSPNDYEMMHFFPQIFHFETKASNKPGRKDMTSISSVTVEWFIEFKKTRLMIKWYISSASRFLRTDIHNHLRYFSSGSAQTEHVVK